MLKATHQVPRKTSASQGTDALNIEMDLNMTKVLITGMSGLIGGLLKEHLKSSGSYELSALNRSKVEGVRNYRADISDINAIRPGFEGQDVAIHLAAYLGSDDWEGQLSSNIVGTYNVFEAARIAGVKRLIFASSGNAIRGYERVQPYSAIAEGNYESIAKDFPRITHEQIRPEGIYGAAKVFGEALGRYYSDAYGMSVLCVRIGSVQKDNRPHSTRERSIYLSHRDVVQILHRCIDAPSDLMYDVFLATSKNKWGYRDLSHAREVLGYEPQDSADVFFE